MSDTLFTSPEAFTAELAAAPVASVEQESEQPDSGLDNLETEEGAQTEAESETVEEEVKDSTEEAEAKKGETEEETLHEVTVDGVKEKITLETALKSYERFKASTNRFQQASDMRKEAEAIKETVEKEKEQAKQSVSTIQANVHRLLTDAEFAYSIFSQYGQGVLDKLVERVGKQWQLDKELYEKDPSLYSLSTDLRKRESEIMKAQQNLHKQLEDLNRKKQEVDSERETSKQKEVDNIVQRTEAIYSESVPKALKDVGIPDDLLSSRVITTTLREIYESSWPEKLLLKDVGDYVAECAKELIKDPVIKKLISGNSSDDKGNGKSEIKHSGKKQVTVTQPQLSNKKGGWIRPSDFFGSITK